MSHMTRAETAIKDVKEPLLREAVEQVARSEGLTLTTEVTSYEKTKAKVTLGLQGPGLTRGIGFDIKDGRLQIVGDPYQQSGYNDVQSKVLQHYTLNAATRSAVALGYKPTQRVKQGDKITITLVAP